MKHKILIEVTAESYEEEQYLLNKFPDEWWDNRDGIIRFYVPDTKVEFVKEVIKEYEERSKK